MWPGLTESPLPAPAFTVEVSPSAASLGHVAVFPRQAFCARPADRIHTDEHFGVGEILASPLTASAGAFTSVWGSRPFFGSSKRSNRPGLIPEAVEQQRLQINLIRAALFLGHLPR